MVLSYFCPSAWALMEQTSQASCLFIQTVCFTKDSSIHPPTYLPSYFSDYPDLRPASFCRVRTKHQYSVSVHHISGTNPEHLMSPPIYQKVIKAFLPYIQWGIFKKIILMPFRFRTLKGLFIMGCLVWT